MLFLGIDTSGKSGGVTLAEGDAHSFRILGSSPISGGTFSAQLVPTIAALLQNQGRSIKDVEGFAVASGPGSFTGLRVGLSAVKGLAEISGKPIATVSLLEGLAVASGVTGRVGAALDAGRSEIFFGDFKISPSNTLTLGENLLSHGEFLESLDTTDLNALATSDESVAKLVSAAPRPIAIQVKLCDRPESAAIARIGLKKLLSGETVSVDVLDANYMRRSDAEIFSKGRQ